MKLGISIASLFLSFNAFAQAPAAAGAVGRWKTIDDKTGQPKSIVEITENGGELRGYVRELLNPTEPNPLCKNCEGDKKDKPVKDLEILWGLKAQKSGDEWSGGSILDPQNGKTYKARLRLKENGEKLEVRGFIGISLIGRSQIWLRDKPAM